MSTLYGSESLAISLTGSVTFPVPLTSRPYVLLGIENEVDGSPMHLDELAPIVTEILEPVLGSYTGFNYNLKTLPDTLNYKLTYSLNASASVTETQTVIGPGRRLDKQPLTRSGNLAGLRIPVLRAGRSVPELLEVKSLRELFCGVMLQSPTAVNSQAVMHEIRVIESDDTRYLTIGVGPNQIGRIPLNDVDWTTQDKYVLKQTFSVSLTSLAESHEIEFPTPFAGAPVDPPRVTYAFRYVGVGTPSVIQSIIVGDVTHTGFTIKTGPIPDGDYVLEGHADQSL